MRFECNASGVSYNAAVSFVGSDTFENFSTQNVFYGVFPFAISRMSFAVPERKKTVSRILMFNLHLLPTGNVATNRMTYVLFSLVFVYSKLRHFDCLGKLFIYCSRFPFPPLFDSLKMCKEIERNCSPNTIKLLRRKLVQSFAGTKTIIEVDIFFLYKSRVNERVKETHRYQVNRRIIIK